MDLKVSVALKKFFYALTRAFWAPPPPLFQILDPPLVSILFLQRVAYNIGLLK